MEGGARVPLPPPLERIEGEEGTGGASLLLKELYLAEFGIELERSLAFCFSALSFFPPPRKEESFEPSFDLDLEGVVLELIDRVSSVAVVGKGRGATGGAVDRRADNVE